MAELTGWLTAPDGPHALVNAAMAHLDLVSIHPVGRTRARYYAEGARFPAGAIAAARIPMPVVSPYSIGR